MTRQLLTGNGAAAWGARLAQVNYIPAFPITPQTEIIENIAFWIDEGAMDARLTTLESEHSMITAAGAAAATGVRVFTATSSQGLLYAMEMLFTVAGWRTPFVLVNVSRGLSAPITLESDHNDILSARDSGFIQIHCATCQEVVDSVVMAYRLAEDKRVRLPAIINLDGFTLSFTREPVELPDAAQCRELLGPFDPDNMQIRASTPESMAVAVLGGGPYSYFRYQMHLASEQALSVYDHVAQEFADRFGRHYPAVEGYQHEDAEYLFFMIGAFASKAKAAVDRLRVQGIRIGLLRPCLLRPYPTYLIQQLTRGKKAIAVIDQNLSLGAGGILYTELKAALYDQTIRPLVLSFVGGLGGRDIKPVEFDAMAMAMQLAVETGHAPEPRLMYNADELREMRGLQAIARVEGDPETTP